MLVRVYEHPSTKIVGQIEHVLFDAQIKHIKKQGLWPSVFDS